MRAPDAEAVLDRVPYFRDLRPDERVRAAERLRIERLAPGAEAAVPAGGPAMVLVLDGEVEVARGGEEPDRLFAGDSWGEADVVVGRGDAPRVRAVGPATVATIDRATMESLFAEMPVVALAVLTELGRELAYHNDVLREVCLARAAGLGPSALQAVLKRRRRRLLRHRRSPLRRLASLLWRTAVVDPARRPAFWTLVGALGALVGARTVVAYIIANGLQKRLFALVGSAAGNPVHVHHFNYGLLLVSIVGLLSMLPRARRALRLLALAFGIGVGLVVDEFALLWNLHPDYYQPSSRLAAAVVLFVIVQGVWFRAAYAFAARRLLAWVRS